MRRFVVQVATSVDGYIARPDGDVGWLDRPRPPGDYGMSDFYKTVDTIVMGRKTWDFARKFSGSSGKQERARDASTPKASRARKQPAKSRGGKGLWGGMRTYVFSRQEHEAEAGVEFVKEGAGDFARRLRDEPGGNVWLMGGAELVASFLDAGEVDELVIHVVPTLIGEGIPLIAPRQRLVALDLQSSRQFPDGVVQLRYRVPGGSSAPPGRRRGGGKRGVVRSPGRRAGDAHRGRPSTSLRRKGW